MPGPGSSSTSSRASGSSCTSDGPGTGHIAGLVRLGHPFPSLLNGVATAAIAGLATGFTGDLLTPIRLGLAMFALQVSIGAVNDLTDAAADRDAKPGKPLPRGVVGVGEARVVAGVAVAIGLGLTVPSGPPAIAVAVAGTALGYLYDLWLSRSRWSWLPFALGLPLVPIYAWLGSATDVPGGLIGLVPVAIVAGAGLALANGIVDEGRDRTAGIETAVVRLGRARAWILHLGCFAIVLAIVALVGPRPDGGGAAQVWAIGVGLGSLVILAGAALLTSDDASARERGWELEALATALVGVAWIAGVAATAGAPALGT